MRLSELGHHEVDTASLDESAREAAARMHQRTVGSLVVVSRRGEPIRIVTDRDLMVRVIAKGLDPATTRVEEVMSAPLVTVGVESTAQLALALMRKGAFRRLPVIGRTGRLTGIITLDDLVVSLATDFGEIRELLRQESPEAAAESHHVN